MLQLMLCTGTMCYDYLVSEYDFWMNGWTENLNNGKRNGRMKGDR